MKRARGFTLLEVMVALAILGVGFMALMEAHGRAALATLDARNVTIGTFLARGKMLDVEYELKKDGFGDYDLAIEGDFSEEGYPDFKYSATARKIEIPVGQLGDSAGQLGTLTSLLGEGAGGATESALGSSENAPNLGMLTPIFTIASDIFGACTREVTLVVTFPPTGRLPDMKVTTHMVDDVCLAREMAKIPGVPGLPGLPGGLPPGALPPGATPPGATPPGSTPPPSSSDKGGGGGFNPPSGDKGGGGGFNPPGGPGGRGGFPGGITPPKGGPFK
ncbi:MAG: prepilin-type N-terminal cleavage/methylation domain-containing protein [Myxococcota bacterium]